MSFGQALEVQGNKTTTLNGCEALKSTGSALVDLYGTIGAMRKSDVTKKEMMFDEAVAEDKLSAFKLLFYGRDIRGGVGERDTFRQLLQYAAIMHTDSVVKNIPLIGLYGRYDDLYCLIDTPAEAAMWKYMSEQFEQDIQNMNEGKKVSLLAKWIKTPDSSHESTAKLGKLTANKLGYRNNRVVYGKTLKKLRKYIGIVEPFVSTRQWDKIDYSVLPSRAYMAYKKLFESYDYTRFTEFVMAVNKGKETLNTGAITPYDIVHDYVKEYLDALSYGEYVEIKRDNALEAAWKSLEDFIDTDFLTVCDTSGSMFMNSGRPAEVALSLAIYSAEHNKGEFHNKFITFSDCPEVQLIKGETLAAKIASLSTTDWGQSTNVEKSLKLIADIGIENHLSNDEMPKALLIVSDMQFNEGTRAGNIVTDEIREIFKSAGYDMPNIIYWNVNDLKTVFHVRRNEKGVQLASGCSPVILKSILANMGSTPYEAMMDVLNSERYSLVTV